MNTSVEIGSIQRKPFGSSERQAGVQAVSHTAEITASSLLRYQHGPGPADSIKQSLMSVVDITEFL